MLTEYLANGKTYVCLKEVLPIKPYARGIPTVSKLIAKKEYQDVIGGKIVDGKLVVLNGSLKSKNTKFVNKMEIMVLFEEDSKEIVAYDQAPPILYADDLVFFKDDDGMEHHVLMRGQREKDKIFFRLKDVEKVFQMNRLDKNVQECTTHYNEGTHYKWFQISDHEIYQEFVQNLDKSSIEATNQEIYQESVRSSYKSSIEATDKSDISSKEAKRSKELYFTYIGIKHLIEVARSGVAYKFKIWIDDVIFAVSFGTVEQKAVALARSFDTDINHLKAVMNKTSNDISCLYLIDVKLVDTNKKAIYKYGMTKHLSRRMNEHKRKYGDNIELIQWSMVPEQYLPEAETMIRNTTKPYSYTDKAGEKELISLNNDELKSVISMYDIVGKHYLGCANEIKHYYEDQIKDTKHEASLRVLAAEHETKMVKQKMVILETKIVAQASQIESQASQIDFLQQLVLKYMNTHGSSE